MGCDESRPVGGGTGSHGGIVFNYYTLNAAY